MLGFGAIYWALGLPMEDALVVSGSSLLTLGFREPGVAGGDGLAFIEAAIGLALVALLISYLPTIYSAFSRRELLVSLLEVRADSPPSPVVMITRMHRVSGLDVMHEMYEKWENWFAELEETHSSLPVLVFYRSQQHDKSWVNAAGAMMDAAALMRSAVAVPPDVQADLMIRAGLHRAPPDRARSSTSRSTRTRCRPTRRASIASGSTRLRRPRGIRRAASSRTATRRGATSTAGGSTTTRCSASSRS